MNPRNNPNYRLLDFGQNYTEENTQTGIPFYFSVPDINYFDTQSSQNLRPVHETQTTRPTGSTSTRRAGRKNKSQNIEPTVPVTRNERVQWLPEEEVAVSQAWINVSMDEKCCKYHTCLLFFFIILILIDF